MQQKSNVKKPDRIILFEIGIIIALLFVNYALEISYKTNNILDNSSEDSVLDIWEISSFVEPQLEVEEQPKPKMEKEIQEAIVFDPSAIIKEVDNLFDTKPLEMKAALPPGIRLIKPLVIPASQPDTSNLVVTFPEIQPQFPGGEEALRKYIARNFNIPPVVLETQDEVSMVVEFVIDKNGEVSDFKVINSSVKGMGTEESAKQLYMNMPKWTPGKNNGKAANVRLLQPIKINVY